MTSHKTISRTARRRACLASAAVLTLIGALAGCGSDESAGSADGQMTLRLLQDPQTLDPQQAADIISRGLADFAYDTLVAVRDGKIVPEIAESWKVNPTQIDMKIRDGVTCSDGSDLTLKDVADSIERMKEPTAASRSDAFGPGNDFTVSTDDANNTVSVKLDNPYGGLLFGMSNVYVICRDGLDNPQSLTSKTDGTGPFALDSATPGDSYTYTAHEGYDWAPTALPSGAEAASGITFRVITSESTAVNSFLTGDLDVVGAQGEDRARLEGNDYVTHTDEQHVDNITLYPNELPGRPTADVNVRKALFAGLDRQSIATLLYGDGTEVAKTVQREGGLCFEPDTTSATMPTYDVEAAKQYLSDAGYEFKDGKAVDSSGQPLTIKVVIPSLFGTSIGDAFISEWEKVGVTVVPNVTDKSASIVRAEGGDWDLYLAGFSSLSPTELLNFTQDPSPTGENFSGVQNDKFNQLAKAASVEDTQSACDQWADAESELYAQADIIPVAKVVARFYGHGTTFSANLLSSVHSDGLAWEGSGE